MIFTVEGRDMDMAVASLTVAGWTGRSQDKVQHHIEELAAIGIAPPSTTPLFYRAAKECLTQSATVDVLGPDSSGEAEPILTSHNGKLLIGLASDHTDRALEAHSIPHSKQVCPKPVSKELWTFDSVADIEALEITCEVPEGDGWSLYQSGTVAAILPLRGLWDEAGLGDGDWMLCGTFPAIGGIRASAAYRMTMRDPGTDRVITHEYAARVMPIVT